MQRILVKRLFAFLIDYTIIILYAGILFLISMVVQNIIDYTSLTVHPVKGQIIGFLTLTLPVFLYFFLTEKSSRKATIGKRINKLQITFSDNLPATAKQVFIRNLLKLLPWEAAHTGVHWLFYFSGNNKEIPLWVYLLLIIPQVIVFGYFLSIIISKGAGSFYDRIARTKMVIQS